jgi:aspartate-semialdehyde dehydrogenase
MVGEVMLKVLAERNSVTEFNLAVSERSVEKEIEYKGKKI